MDTTEIEKIDTTEMDRIDPSLIDVQDIRSKIVWLKKRKVELLEEIEEVDFEICEIRDLIDEEIER